MRILPLNSTDKPSYFVNGFAANDATSTINIWKRVVELGYPTDEPIIVMNCRQDRVDRTKQFAYDVLPKIKCKSLVLIGETTEPIVEAFDKGMIPADHLINLEGKSSDEVINVLSTDFENRVIFGVGNIHGAAEPLIEKLEKLKIKQLVS
jgi:gamma-polyglutamate synthase